MVARERAYTDLYTTDIGKMEKERKTMEENQGTILINREVCRQDVDDLIFAGETGYISER